MVSMTQLVADRPRQTELLVACGERLAQLVAEDDWLPDDCAAVHPDHYCQYLLHCDPLERFSVVSFVWGPEQRTSIHDHRTWGAVGLLRGTEASTRFSRDAASGRLIRGATTTLQAGDVELLSPQLGDIHQVRNAGAGTAVSIHVYGANIGAVKRHSFDPDTGEPTGFVSGYTSQRVPNLWDRSRE